MSTSVVMAVHNGERYLPELLGSLAAQTAPPHELVVHDDASTDSTPRQLEEFAAGAPFPVRLERGEEQRGHTAAFLDAAERAEGDTIAFCDHDDVWLPEKLAICARELDRTGAALVLHATRVVDDELRDLGITWPAIERTHTVRPLGATGLEIDAPGMAMVFRREVLGVGRDRRRPPSRYDPARDMLHDEWTLFLAGAVAPVTFLSDPLVLYRQHASNDSGGWVHRRRGQSLDPALDDYRRAAEHTRACARFLAEAAGDHPELRQPLLDAAGHYERIAASWDLRRSLYQAGPRRSRARLLGRLVGARAYRDRTGGGLGRAALAKDLAGGLLMRRGPR